ncbi:arylsulfatase B-like [Tropilaelaps mercedesae]|uniref:Arylsulfatase B-like n=1 Tax=Tropilaelaps mercedesae TaxID=418985 RepID=A0A1V9XSC4_9ACAR|nr:arylsulfatase B-like [Tropilaelaps mercedesae]
MSHGKLSPCTLQNHNKSIPLFLYLAHQSVHVGGGVQPLQVPAPLVGLYDTKIIHDKRRHYAPMVLAADKSIETFMNAMKKYGFDNNSIVIFTNDNGGPANGMHGGGSSNYPLRGSKYTLWEGGIRGTAAIWAPQLLQPKKYTGLTHISDFLPTLLEALDLPIPQGIDGISFWNQILTGKESARTE